LPAPIPSCEVSLTKESQYNRVFKQNIIQVAVKVKILEFTLHALDVSDVVVAN
jgi:hypothetical protein